MYQQQCPQQCEVKPLGILGQNCERCEGWEISGLEETEGIPTNQTSLGTQGRRQEEEEQEEEEKEEVEEVVLTIILKYFQTQSAAEDDKIINI